MLRGVVRLAHILVVGPNKMHRSADSTRNDYPFEQMGLSNERDW